MPRSGTKKTVTTITSPKTKKYKSKVRVKYPGSKGGLTIRRTIVAPITDNGPGFDTGLNYFFAMSQVPNFSEITNMFKRIKLNGVSIKWCPAYTESPTGSTSTHVYTAINPDNINTGVPTSASIREQNNCVIRNWLRKFRVNLKPVLKLQAGQAGVTTYYIDAPCTKYNLSPTQADMRYYGFDWLIPETGLPIGTKLGTFEITYSIKCIGPK